MKILVFLILCFPLIALGEMLLYSEDGDFHGCLDCGKYDSESVCAKYGDYGSKYSNASIWNKYGVGGKYDDRSPFNKYGTGLKIVDREGNFYGYFSRSFNADRKVRTTLNDLWESVDGDYSKMRDIYCEK